MAQHPRLDFFPVGSSYYPPFHTGEDWERDFRRMAEAGLNSLRTAEMIASWEWLEPKKGHFDWSWLERTFELCQQYNIKIMLGTGAGSPPIWLLDQYPDVQILSQDGVPYPTGTMWGWACIHNPGFLAESERYLRILLERYKDHSMLLGWQIHNEPGYPAIQRMPGAVEMYCYCEHTAAGFREWLKKKYPDPDALSVAWASTPSHHRYSSWSQVRPPRTSPLTWGTVGSWLDWREYLDQSTADFITWQNRIIKEIDPVHPTCTNLVHLLENDLGVIRGINPWLYPKTCDVFGFDLYPMDFWKQEPNFTSVQLDYARAPALHHDQDFWLPEIESGPIGQWVLGPMHATTPQDIRRYDLDSIAHGAKMLLYQGYREWDPLPLHWGALVDLNGEPTGRYHEAAKINQVLKANQELFLKAQPVRSQIGILVDQKNAIACVGMGASEMLTKGIKGAYYALWSQHYPVEFITPELLAEGKGDQYKLLVMPFLMLVTPLCARAVRKFLEHGGTAVAFAKCGMLDERSWYWHDRPGGMTDLFGVKETSIERREEIRFDLDPAYPFAEGISSPVAGHWHQQSLLTMDNVSIIGRYPDGTAAATVNAVGAGRAVLFGTHVDVAALNPQALANHQLFDNLAAQAGVVRPFQLQASPLVDGHLLTHRDQRLFILVNHGAAAEEARVALPDHGGPCEAFDLFSEERLPLVRVGDRLHFQVPLNGFGSTAIIV